MQDTYLRLATGTPAVPIAHAQAYIYRVAGNLAIDHLRREVTRQRTFETGGVSEFVASETPDAEAQLLARERLQTLLDAVGDLPPRCREIFVLCKLEGLDQADIAHRLGISRKMVERHLRKALLYCQMRLTQGA